jgi:phosphoglycerate dehydrogenase-like enzyme
MTLLALAPPAERWLAALDRLPADLRIVAGNTAEAFSAGACAEAEAVLTIGSYRALLEELWPRMPRLRWVHSLSAGLETLLFPALVESPVVLTNSRGVFARSLSEFALAGMLWFAKDLNRMRRQQAAARWEKFNVTELHGRTLAIVGHGSIGRETAHRAEAFGMTVRAFRRSGSAGLQDTLRGADYVLVSAPLTAETRGLIGAPELALLPPHAVLLNLGRGPVVDEAALVAALRKGRLRGAVLDVYDTEPLPPGHPFWGMDNVLLSPHCADNTDTWMDEAMDLFVRNFESWASGQPLENITDKRAGY